MTFITPLVDDGGQGCALAFPIWVAIWKAWKEVRGGITQKSLQNWEERISQPLFGNMAIKNATRAPWGTKRKSGLRIGQRKVSAELETFGSTIIEGGL